MPPMPRPAFAVRAALSQHRAFLASALLLATTVGTLLAWPRTTVGAVPARLASPPAPAAADKGVRGNLMGAALGVAGDKTEIRAWLAGQKLDGLAALQKAGRAGQVEWTVEAGQARIWTDRYTGRTYAEPLGTRPVVVRPRLGSLLGKPVLVGISAKNIAFDERQLTAYSGGACNSKSQNTLLSMVGPGPLEVKVNAFLDNAVIPLSATQRVIRFQYGEYYTHHPQLGTMRITYNPTQVSEAVMTTLGQGSFFPASVESRFYYVFELLDSGIRMFNKEPLVLTSAATDWPIFREPMVNQASVTFYDAADPDLPLLTVEHQEAYIYPTEELAVTADSFSIDAAGFLDATYTIRNTTADPGNLRWFVIGNPGAPVTPIRGGAAIGGLGATVTVSIRTRVQPASVPQFVSLGVVSESGVRLSGSKRIEFSFPPLSAAKLGGPRALQPAAVANASRAAR